MIRKIFIILLIILITLPTQLFQVLAITSGDTVNLQRHHWGYYSVQKKNDKGKWIYLTYNLVTYKDENNIERVAYCVEPELPGPGWVGEGISDYDVLLTQTLSNVKLWRVYINGYPYKTPAQMGCEAVDDAYLATKHAAYWVLANKPIEDIRTTYRPGQTVIENQDLEETKRRGQKVIDAMYNLVYEAYYGTQTPANSDIIDINKVGGFVQDTNSNYYSQTYKPTSSVDMSKFVVSAIEDFPSGSYVANINGTAQTTFNSGESFKIMVPKANITKNTTGTIYLLGKCKTYPVYYAESTVNGYQDHAICCDPYGDITEKTTLNIKESSSIITVNKTDAETGKKLSGITFGIYNSSGTQIASAKTNSEGIATFKNIAQGTYKLREIATLDNYILNSQEFTINVEYNKNISLNITNYHKKGNLKINKTDSETSTPIAGVTFQLLDSSGTVVASGTTDEKGELYFDNLNVGNYKLKETATNNNYVLNKTEFDVTIEYNKTTTKNITNDYKKGHIQINKTDNETSKGIEGVTFGLYKTDGTEIAKATTNSKGIANFKDIRIGKYILKELSTNSNYVLNTTEFEVAVEYNKTTIKDITNEHKRGDLTIFKVDKDNNRIGLGNVVFDLYSAELNKVIGTYTTDVNGEIAIKNLRTGEYKLIEKSTNRWYNLAEDTNLQISWNEMTNAVVENELKKGSIKVIKIDKENNEIKIPGVVFQVLDEKNNILETIVTNKEGVATSSSYAIRDFEKLKLREIRTNENYILNTEIKTIELKENKISTITFENELKKGQIKIIKVDFDNNEIPIPNVEFNIYDESGNVVDTLITDENGEAVSKKLPINQEYTIKEIKTDDSYVLNETTQTITPKYNKITDLTFTNEKKKGQIEIIKIDKDNHETFLEGVSFEIVDSNNNVVDTIITNSEGKAVSKRLPIDEQYTIRETKTKSEYVLSEETKKVELKQDEITSLTFENEKIKGYLEITKIDSKKKTPLKDVVFGIYDNRNNLVEEIITDTNGKATSNLLPIGKYYAKELKTSSPYFLLNENTYEFEIIKNNEVIPITIENDATDIKVNVEKEGTVEVKPNEIVNYTFTNVANESNIYLDNFKWIDYIPTEYVRLEKMTTGTWNQDLQYKVLYKTNKSSDYIVFEEKLSTLKNYDLDFTTLKLAEDEYITETSFDFGTVDIGFKETFSPTMQCKALESLTNGETFTNHTKTTGVYYGLTANAESTWTTIVHVPEEPKPTLPRTGYFN